MPAWRRWPCRCWIRCRQQRFSWLPCRPTLRPPPGLQQTATPPLEAARPLSVCPRRRAAPWPSLQPPLTPPLLLSLLFVCTSPNCSSALLMCPQLLLSNAALRDARFSMNPGRATALVCPILVRRLSAPRLLMPLFSVHPCRAGVSTTPGSSAPHTHSAHAPPHLAALPPTPPALSVTPLNHPPITPSIALPREMFVDTRGHSAPMCGCASRTHAAARTRAVTRRIETSAKRRDQVGSTAETAGGGKGGAVWAGSQARPEPALERQKWSGVGCSSRWGLLASRLGHACPGAGAWQAVVSTD